MILTTSWWKDAPPDDDDDDAYAVTKYIPQMPAQKLIKCDFSAVEALHSLSCLIK